MKLLGFIIFLFCLINLNVCIFVLLAIFSYFMFFPSTVQDSLLHSDIFLLCISLWELIYFQARNIIKPHNILILMLPRGSAIKSFLFFLKHEKEMHKDFYFFVVVGMWNFTENSKAGMYMSAINKVLSSQGNLTSKYQKETEICNYDVSFSNESATLLPEEQPYGLKSLIESWKNSQTPFPWRKRIL